jgi:hypothetical protein
MTGHQFYKLVSSSYPQSGGKAVDNSLGILVWATLIAGSITALFLALRDVIAWCAGVVERVHGADRDALEHRVMVPTITVAAERLPAKKRF